MVKSSIILKKVTKVTEKWNEFKDMINVKFSEHSGWFLFKGVENGMFVLAQRNGETFRTNQIFVRYYV